jgi:hypothetical protein
MRCPTSSPRRPTRARRRDDQPGAVGRLRVRARVRPHPTRCLQDRPGRAIAGAGAVRGVARARRRRGVFGSVQKSGDKVVVRCGLFNVRTRQQVFSKEYSGTRPIRASTPHDRRRSAPATAGASRGRPHQAEFVSDRNRERLVGPIDNREVKEIYISDYDGANQRRITTTTPAQHYALMVARRARSGLLLVPERRAADIHLASSIRACSRTPRRASAATTCRSLARRNQDRVHVEPGRQPRDLRHDRDGSNVRRLTDHPAGDGSPTWSPTGSQIAFTSDRTGTGRRSTS